MCNIPNLLREVMREDGSFPTYLSVAEELNVTVKTVSEWARNPNLRAFRVENQRKLCDFLSRELGRPITPNDLWGV